MLCKATCHSFLAGLSESGRIGRLYARTASPMKTTKLKVISSGCQLNTPDVSLAPVVGSVSLGENRSPPKRDTQTRIETKMII